MKKSVLLLFGSVLITSCSLIAQDDTQRDSVQQLSVATLVQETEPQPKSVQQLSVETLVREAEATYAYYLAQPEYNQEMATQKTAAEVQKRKGVSEVRVLSPGRLFLVFADGNELLLMLGQDTL